MTLSRVVSRIFHVEKCCDLDDILSRLDTIHQCDIQTDGQTYTGRQQRPHLRIASRGKNEKN